jgi:hypothetical protein
MAEMQHWAIAEFKEVTILPDSAIRPFGNSPIRNSPIPQFRNSAIPQ